METRRSGDTDFLILFDTDKVVTPIRLMNVQTMVYKHVSNYR